MSDHQPVTPELRAWIIEQATAAALERLEAEYAKANKKPVPIRPGAGG